MSSQQSACPQTKPAPASASASAATLHPNRSTSHCKSCPQQSTSSANYPPPTANPPKPAKIEVTAGLGGTPVDLSVVEACLQRRFRCRGVASAHPPAARASADQGFAPTRQNVSANHGPHLGVRQKRTNDRNPTNRRSPHRDRHHAKHGRGSHEQR